MNSLARAQINYDRQEPIYPRQRELTDTDVEAFIRDLGEQEPSEAKEFLSSYGIDESAAEILCFLCKKLNDSKVDEVNFSVCIWRYMKRLAYEYTDLSVDDYDDKPDYVHPDNQ